jgi:phage terminase small subunit
MRTKAALEPLPPKRRQFVEAMASGMTATKAAKVAGYSERNPHIVANAMLNDQRVRNELARLQRENRERNQITRDEVLCGLKEAIKDAKLTSDPMAQISGWREIARMCGYYEPIRHEVVLSPELSVAREQVKAMPTEKLLELAGPDVIDAEFKLVVEDDDNDDED